MIKVRDWYLPDDETHMNAVIDHNNSYQEKHRQTALSYVKNFRTAIDIGAHIGLWTRDLAKKFEVVHAFEPIEKMIECFNENIYTNPENAFKVHLHPCLIGNENREDAAMAVHSDNTGKSHVDLDSTGDYIMYKLDKIASILDIQNVDYIKIDAESFEEFIIVGAHETIRKWRPIISIEQKPHPYYEGKEGYTGRYGAKDALEQLGMKLLNRVSDDLIMGW